MLVVYQKRCVRFILRNFLNAQLVSAINFDLNTKVHGVWKKRKNYSMSSRSFYMIYAHLTGEKFSGYFFL